MASVADASHMRQAFAGVRQMRKNPRLVCQKLFPKFGQEEKNGQPFQAVKGNNGKTSG